MSKNNSTVGYLDFTQLILELIKKSEKYKDMFKATVELQQVAGIETAVIGMGYSHGKDYRNLSEEEQFNKLKRLIDLGHMSVLEHITISYSIHNITRTLLQELARHRIASYTVQSTRFTLKKVVTEFSDIMKCGKIDPKQVKKYFYCPNEAVYNQTVDIIRNMLDFLKKNPKAGNDSLKYLLPENFYVSNVMMTINFRSLLNLLELRLSKNALFEFRNLAIKLIAVLPLILEELAIYYIFEIKRINW